MGDFVYYNLGYLHGGEIVEVSISTRANVCLLDSSNFFNYKSGRDFRYIGGNISSSPCRLSIPRAGQWYVTIDLGGRSGSISSGVRVIKPEPETLRRNMYFVLPDQTIVYYDELSGGKVRLADIVRNGYSRSSGGQVFNSIQQLIAYCKSVDWSQY